MDFLHLEEALEQTPHPQQGDQGQTQQIYPAEDPIEESASIRLLADKAGVKEVIGLPDQIRTSTQEPLAFGPCTSPSPRQQKLNKVRKEEASPNPRKRARESTPFTPHDTPVVISSDEEDEQDKTSPTSPPDHEKGHPAVYEYQPKSPAYPSPSDSSDEEDSSSMPDL